MEAGRTRHVVLPSRAAALRREVRRNHRVGGPGPVRRGEADGLGSNVLGEEAVEVAGGGLGPGVAARPVAPLRLKARLHLPHRPVRPSQPLPVHAGPCPLR
jgi:hypothetical protein